MKIFKIKNLSLLVVTLAALNQSCTREIPQVAPLATDLASKANVQVFSSTLKAARNYVYVDGVTVSGATFSYNGVFPGTAYSFIVEPGSRSVLIKDTLAATTQTQLTFSQAFDAGKSYTVFTYDTVTSVKQLTVQNSITVPADTTSMLRFGNFIYNNAAVPNVDVYSFKRIPGTPVLVNTPVLNSTAIFVPVFTGSTPVFNNIATNQASPFVPYASGVTDTLYVFATGTTSPLLAKGFITSLVPTRSYTSVYNGSYRGALSTRTVTTFVTY